MPVDELGKYRDYLMILARSQIAIDLRARIDPSDLVQDTLCDALRNQPRSRARTRAETMGWLRSVLKFNLIDRLRRLTLERRVVSLDGSLDQTSVGMSRLPQRQLYESTPSARVVREEYALTLAAMLGQLSQAQAEAIVLKHCQGMSVRATWQRPRLRQSPSAKSRGASPSSSGSGSRNLVVCTGFAYLHRCFEEVCG